MEFQSIDDIIQFAIEKEKEAADFYRTAAQKESGWGIKDVLIGFAKEEEKHEKMLKDLKNNKDKITNYVFKRIQDIKRSDYLVDLDYKPGMTYFEFLRLAMKREEKAHLLYDKLAQSSDDSEHADFFNILSREELKHKSALETTYDDHMAAQGD